MWQAIGILIYMSRGFNPRHARTAGDLGFAMQINAGISQSSAIILSDSPQSNNSKGNFIHPTWDTNILVSVIFSLPRLHQCLHWCGICIGSAVERRTRVRHWQSDLRLWPDMRRLQLPLNDRCRLVLPLDAVQHVTDRTYPKWPSPDGGEKYYY